MKSNELIEGKRVVSISSKPIVGFIVDYSCLRSNREKTNLVRIQKLDGITCFVTADCIKPFKTL